MQVRANKANSNKSRVHPAFPTYKWNVAVGSLVCPDSDFQFKRAALINTV